MKECRCFLGATGSPIGKPPAALCGPPEEGLKEEFQRCLTHNSMAEVAKRDPEVGGFLRAYMARVEALFHRHLKKAERTSFEALPRELLPVGIRGVLGDGETASSWMSIRWTPWRPSPRTPSSPCGCRTSFDTSEQEDEAKASAWLLAACGESQPSARARTFSPDQGGKS